MPGSIGKAGAEPCYAIGLADGRAVSQSRSRLTTARHAYIPLLMAAALEQMGVDGEAVGRRGRSTCKVVTRSSAR